MGMFNRLSLFLRCPRCGIESEMEAEFKFGLLNLEAYHLGDTIRWREVSGRPPQTRPPEGNHVGEGYVECPNCHKDFWIVIDVRRDVIDSARIDTATEGYIR
jgi:hypothetical protein